jgi:indole-3-glycerol phosphate synthase
MADFLTQMAVASRERVRRARAAHPESRLRQSIAASSPPRALAIRRGAFHMIAEVKRRGPSTGDLTQMTDRGERNISEQAASYVAGGAQVVSVLTEPTTFDGDLEDIPRVAGVIREPIMRKDFLVDPYQAVEARASGADGILVIVRMLDRVALRELLDTAVQLRLFVLLELFGEEDLDTLDMMLPWTKPDRTMVGVNSRDLTTLRVDPVRLEKLVDHLPTHLPRVAESGLETREDVRRVAALGYDAALIGSALMRASNPEATVRSMLAAGQEEVTRSCM